MLNAELTQRDDATDAFNTKTQAKADTELFHGMVGQSPAMEQLFYQIRLIGRASGPVLIQGESGSGKEAVARALCAESPRANKPFIAVNCAGIPQELLEAEFFGHTSGAFTGAVKGRKGLLQEADGGTLFLDEIAEMPLPLQAKLLRALQDGSLRPVGENHEHQVDVRIIAATHQNLPQRIAEGAFREDLYYRLETFTLAIPPLRERGDDVIHLAQALLNTLPKPLGLPKFHLSLQAQACLQHYHYPGNVRELQNILERAMAFAEGGVVHCQHLPERVQQARQPQRGQDPVASSASNEFPTLAVMQQRYVRQVLDSVDGNKRRAAQILGIGRRTLYRWLDDEVATSAKVLR